ncbi:MAG TPA: helix-turn-helix transcriptional regulator [Streptosporangiaceae bacterium]|nr:helix-turn-helix transcriptional regulator [Streptosporangiaceae bacterium]
MPNLVFLGRELRRAREAAGMSQAQLADTVNYAPSFVSMVESADRMPKKDFTEACDRALSTGGLLTRLLTELIARDGAPEWFWPWIDIEREAVSLRSFEPLVVYGLLQVPEYTRALVRSWDLGQDEATEQAVTARAERQQVLSKDEPPMLVAVMDEGVLRRPVGGAAIMRKQLDHLLNVSNLPHIIIQVVPSGTGEYAGLAGSFVVAETPDGDMAYLETALSGQTVDQPEQVARIIKRWEALRAEALPQRQSHQLIEEVAQTWK